MDENNENDITTTPKFENLSYGTLRRYQAFYNLRNKQGEICNNKIELLNLIKNHFVNLSIDNDKLI